jgi:glycosyltransferase involved in cell wall biosynthesis
MTAESQPLVSVVVATRNRSEWLRECVQSVRAQDGVPWELIVVDDCSDEVFRDGLARLEAEGTTILRQAAPAERCAARNRGLAHARGEFVMFLDDDDWLWPGALSHLAGALERSPDAVAAVGARWAVFTGEGYERRDAHPRRILKRDILDELVFGWSAVSGQNLYRTAAVRSFGGYEDETLIHCEDRLLWLRMACHGPVVLVPETVMSYRYHPAQQRPDDIIEIRDRVCERVIGDLPPHDRQRLRKMRRAGRLVERAEDTMSRGNPLTAAWLALRAFAIAPGIHFSPLIGEWVIRRLGGRFYRRFFPAQSS